LEINNRWLQVANDIQVKRERIPWSLSY
jgi:hypothetical protein